MDIYVKGCIGASEHFPEVPTLAIRIFDPWKGSPNSPQRELINSPNYTILNYVFDNTLLTDDWRSLRDRHFSFSDDLARTILSDFEKKRTDCEDLLVHCAAGSSRSPAVAIALNEIFKLGSDTSELKRKYSNFSPGIYDIMLKARLSLDIA